MLDAGPGDLWADVALTLGADVSAWSTDEPHRVCCCLCTSWVCEAAWSWIYRAAKGRAEIARGENGGRLGGLRGDRRKSGRGASFCRRGNGALGRATITQERSKMTISRDRVVWHRAAHKRYARCSCIYTATENNVEHTIVQYRASESEADRRHNTVRQLDGGGRERGGISWKFKATAGLSRTGE